MEKNIYISENETISDFHFRIRSELSTIILDYKIEDIIELHYNKEHFNIKFK